MKKYIKSWFFNIKDFEKYLNQFDLKINDISKKIEIELKWNKLIYDKYKDQIIINEEILRKKLLMNIKIKISIIYRINFSSNTKKENEKTFRGNEEY